MFKTYRQLAATRFLDKDLIIIGPYPPPRGGVSMHIYRLIPRLTKNGLNYLVLNSGFTRDENVYPLNKRYLSWLALFIFSIRNRQHIRDRNILFHFHLFSWPYNVFILFFAWFITRRLMITIHNENILSYNRFNRYLTILTLNQIKPSSLIVVSSNLYDYLEGRGITSEWIPAFIPPIRINRKSLEDNLKEKSDILIATVIRNLDEKNIRKYGTDLVFDIMRTFDKTINLCLFVSIEGVPGKDNAVLRNVTPELFDHIHIMYNMSFINYIHNFDVFIRSNREDGYGVSLVEAMIEEVPTIASDVCVRPEGTILFRNGDAEDLCSKLREALADRVVPKQLADDHIDAGSRLIKYYMAEKIS